MAVMWIVVLGLTGFSVCSHITLSIYGRVKFKKVVQTFRVPCFREFIFPSKPQSQIVIFWLKSKKTPQFFQNTIFKIYLPDIAIVVVMVSIRDLTIVGQ